MTVLEVAPQGTLFLKITFGDEHGAPEMAMSLDILNARILAEALQVCIAEMDKHFEQEKKQVTEWREAEEKRKADLKAKKLAKSKSGI